MLVVCQQTAEEHLPFEERRPQPDLLKRRPGRLVLALFGLLERQPDAVEVALQVGRQLLAAGAFQKHRGVGGVRPDRGRARRVGRQPVQQRQRLAYAAGLRHLPRDRLQPRRRSVEAEGGFERGDGVAAVALLAELLGPAEATAFEQFQVGGGRRLLVELFRQLERLLEPALVDGAVDARLQGSGRGSVVRCFPGQGGSGIGGAGKGRVRRFIVPDRDTPSNSRRKPNIEIRSTKSERPGLTSRSVPSDFGSRYSVLLGSVDDAAVGQRRLQLLDGFARQLEVG